MRDVLPFSVCLGPLSVELSRLSGQCMCEGMCRAGRMRLLVRRSQCCLCVCCYRAVLFVIDSVQFSKELRDVASILYDLLAHPLVRKYRLPVLIACNKQGESADVAPECCVEATAVISGIRSSALDHSAVTVKSLFGFLLLLIRSDNQL